MSTTCHILFQDSDTVAVHKPAGVKMHRDGCGGPHEGVLLKKVRALTGEDLVPGPWRSGYT